jgi:alpha-tubulin suppressor-like RCC1 family protein
MAGRGFCWGRNDTGQLGDGTITNRRTPVLVGNGLPFVQVSGGAQHTCGVTPESRAFCWGNNGAGQLGDGTKTQRRLPVPVAGTM